MCSKLHGFLLNLKKYGENSKVITNYLLQAVELKYNT